jgi:type VI secretion system secreted protein VgrG
MNIALRQDLRAAVLETPLGKDKLVLARFDGSEGVSELFEWRIEALSLDGDIDFDALLGMNVTLTITGTTGGKRKFDGILTEAQWLGVRDHFHAYRLVLRPWLWLLSHRTDCFIFHNKSVTTIIAEVFARHGQLAVFEDRTSGAFSPIEYCVQYRESDMGFVCRLMEEYGISHFYVHEDGSHKLVMVDNVLQFDEAPGGSRPYLPLAGQDRRTRECLHHFIPERRFTSGKATFRDYNFKTPSANMEADQSGSGSYEHGDKERYDYPGRYDAQGGGKSLIKVRMQGEEALDRRCMGAGNCVTLFPGSLVSLTGHPFESYNIEYGLVRAQHSYISQQYRSGAGAAGEDSYEGQYEFVKSENPFQPMQVTPRPLVHGPQTAFVVGKEGEEIDCDEYGRILVRFHWDRKSDQSMRCRVAQNWGSKQWGGMIIPRIGMEVMVEFLEGDPDRPLVTGCVYNANSMPPYTLPANKTRSVLRSDSHKSDGFNEMTMEDATGAENLFFHAQKDHTTRVLNNRTARVDSHDVYSVGGNRAVEVAKNQKYEIGGSYNITVGGTGLGALGALAGVAGLAGNTAGLLKQAGDIAGGGGAALGGFAATLASSALGFLSGGGLGSREGVVSGPSPKSDAGVDLAKSGDGVGKAAAGLFPMPGIMNTVIGAFKSESVGVASVEQIGVSKVVNVGATSLESVGKFKKIAVGEEFVIEVGDSKLIMKSNGEILILGKKFNFVATDHFQMRGKPIDLN